MSNRVDVAFGAKLGDLKKGTAQVKAEIAGIGKVAKAQNTAISGLTAHAKGLAAGVLSIGAAAAAVTKALERAGNIQDIFERTGLSPEFLQQLDREARKSGTSIDAIAKGIGKFSKELTNSDGAGTFAETLKGLNLNIDELREKSPEDLFITVSRAVAGIEDPTKRAAVAQNLLSRSGAELIPVMENINSIIADTNVLSAQQIADLDSIGDEWSDLAVDIDKAIGSILSGGGAGGINMLIREFRVFVAEIEAGVAKSKVQISQFRQAWDALKAGDFAKAAELTKPSDAERAISEDLKKRIADIRSGANSGSGAGGGSGDDGGEGDGWNDAAFAKGAASGKPRPNELPAEKAYREALEDSNPANPTYDEGSVRRPGELRALANRAARSRASENRKIARGIGGPARVSRATNAAERLAEKRRGGPRALGGDTKLGSQSAQELADERFGRAKEEVQKAAAAASPGAAQERREQTDNQLLQKIHDVLDERLPKDSIR